MRAAREHVEHLFLQHREVAHVDGAQLHEQLGRHPDGLQVGNRREQLQIGLVVVVAPELGRVGEQADAPEPLDQVGLQP